MRGWLQTRTLIITLGVYGLIAITVTLAYSPGLHGPFVFDDIPNITRNSAIQISALSPSSLYAAMISSHSSALGRPLAMLSFAIDYLIAGDPSNTYAFKLTNLAIHLINTGLVYCFVMLLLRQAATTNPISAITRWLPAFITALWALHPLNLTSVLYVVQRMTSLSALFVLLGMILFLQGRRRVHEQKRYGMVLIVGGWLTGLTLGMGAKETAVSILLYIPLTEYIFFSRDDFSTPVGTHLRAFYGLAIVLPLLMALTWVLTHPQFFQEVYKIRDFNMTSRLLTEPRILWFYLYLLFIPNISEFSLYHDDIPVSTSLFTPWTTLPALCALISMVLAALLWRKKYPVFSFAVLWFLAGHCLESTFLPLELAHEHRNYLPAIGPVVGVTYALAAAFRDRNRIFRILCAAIATVLFGVTFLRAQTWATEETLITTMAQHHPLSARTNAILAEFYTNRRGDFVRAQRHYEIAATLNPGEISYDIRMLINAVKMSTKENAHREKQSAPTVRGPFNNVTVSTQLHDRLKESLSHKSLTPTTVLALDDLASCIAEIPFECRDLYPYAVEWYRWALKNPDVPRDLHKAMSIYLFRISTAQRDYSVALETAVNARSYDPDDISFALMEADARIALRQFGQAEDVLSHAGQDSTSLSPDIINDINILITKIRTTRDSSPVR